MIKKFSSMLCIALFVMTTSCKKEDASSKIDPNAKEIAPADPNAINPEPNIGGPDLPKEAVTKPADGKYPEMTFDAKVHDFGKIKEGDKVTHYFKFLNSGKADLIIKEAKGSCGCTVPEFPKKPLKPGEIGKIKVTFNSDGKSGEQSKTVTVMCNTQSGNEILTIKASINAPEGAKK